MGKRLIVTAVVALVVLVATGTSSAATTQTLRITNCLGSVGNGGTFAVGSDIVATISFGTVSPTLLQTFITNQDGQFGLVTNPALGDTANRVFGAQNFVWRTPRQLTLTGQQKDGTFATRPVWLSDLTIDLGVFPNPGTYYLTLTSVYSGNKTINDGFGFTTKPNVLWLVTSSCPFTVQ